MALYTFEEIMSILGKQGENQKHPSFFTPSPWQDYGYWFDNIHYRRDHAAFNHFLLILLTKYLQKYSKEHPDKDDDYNKITVAMDSLLNIQKKGYTIAIRTAKQQNKTKNKQLEYKTIYLYVENGKLCYNLKNSFEEKCRPKAVIIDPPLPNDPTYSAYKKLLQAATTQKPVSLLEDEIELLRNHLNNKYIRQDSLFRYEERTLSPANQKAIKKLKTIYKVVKKQETTLKSALSDLNKRTADNDTAIKIAALKNALLAVAITKHQLKEIKRFIYHGESPSDNQKLSDFLKNDSECNKQWHALLVKSSVDKKVKAFNQPIKRAAGILVDVALLFSGIGLASVLIKGLLYPITHDKTWSNGWFRSFNNHSSRLLLSTASKLSFYHQKVEKIVMSPSFNNSPAKEAVKPDESKSSPHILIR